MSNAGPDTIILNELAEVLRATDPAALLIRKRLLRRVLWRCTPRRAHGLGLFRRLYAVVDRGTLLDIVAPDELAPYRAQDLPDRLILLGRTNELILGPRQRGPVLRHYWRLLF